MTQLQGLVQHVETVQARSFATADAAISDTVVFVADVAPFLTESGTCVVDIAGVEYEATPDAEASSLALSPALSVAVLEGDPITLLPAAEIKWAYIALDGDDSGDWIQCRVPHELVGYVKFADGPRDLDSQEAVLVETEPEPVIVTMLNQPTSIDATTTPIIVSNADGESARMDADGFNTYTNDPVPVRTIPGAFRGIASDDTHLYAIDRVINNERLRKFDPTTGVEDTSGWPSIGDFERYTIAVDASSVFAIDAASDDIRKFNKATGVETLVGFPIAGTYIDALASNGTNLFAIDSAGDIRKFNASTGAPVAGGFPIVGTYKFGLATDATSLYAIDSAGDIRKFDAGTAVEDTSADFPIAGDFGWIAAHDGILYANESSTQIRKFDAATGTEIEASGFPIEGTFPEGLAADSNYIYAGDNRLDARLFNNTENYRSTLTDSSDGTFTGHAANVSDINAAGNADIAGALDVGGDVEVTGEADIDNLLITWTKARKTANQSTTTAIAETMGQAGETYGAYDGSGTSGDTAYWTESNGVFTILEAGVYDLGAYVQWASNATGYRLVAIIASSAPGTIGTATRTPAASGAATNQTASCRVPLGVGDTVSVLVTQTSGGNLNVEATSYLSISRVGALAP
jgi:hypothetical protein